MGWSSKYGHFDTVLISINRNLRQQCYLCFSIQSKCYHHSKIGASSLFICVSCLMKIIKWVSIETFENFVCVVSQCIFNKNSFMCCNYSEQFFFARTLSFEQIDDIPTCPDRWQLCSFLDRCEYWSSGQWTPPTWQKIFSVPRCLSEGSESLVSAFSETSPQLRQLRTLD